MGLGDLVKDLTPDPIEHAVEHGVEWAGDRVEDVGDWTADRLEDVGWDSGADWVREKSRSLANRMGAEVDEMDLGQTEDKTKLIYGSASKLRATVGHLKDFQTAFNNVGLGLEGLDAESLKGKAADAFRRTVKVEPPKWYKGADAFEDAASALDAFADTVVWAQGKAQTAIDKWKAGTSASEKAADDHKAKVDAYNKAVDQYNAKPADQRDPSELPPKPGEFHDPGTKLMQEAQDILADARKQRNSAAETARSAIRKARDAAPPKPSYTQQATDGLNELNLMAVHFDAGILKGTAGLLNFVRQVNPTDPYNLTHPAQYLTNLDNTVAGLVTVANDPWGTGKHMLDSFLKDPGEGLGQLVPDVVLTVATGGAGAGVKGARTAEELAEEANAARRAERLGDEGDGAGRRAEDPRDPARPPSCKCGGREPVDFATGRMYLPQVDVRLPGTLPLVLRRDFESSYRAGRWFGPSWSSTIDQRLEVDPIGVVFHGEGNVLLRYPHPAPGTPVLPEEGPRLPLHRDPAGGYTLVDPEAGLTYAFHAPVTALPGGDGTALLASVTDRAGRTVTAEYDDAGAPAALVHHGGYRLEFTVEGGRVTELRAAGAGPQPLVRYGYTDGHLTSVADSAGRATRFTYDAEGRIADWTDSNGSRYSFGYDAQDRCVTQGGDEGHLRSDFAYSPPDPATGLARTTVTDSLGQTWEYLVNDRLQVVAETDPTGATARSTYDRYDRVLSRTDPLGGQTRFRYDEAGRLVEVVRPDGSTQQADHDEQGRITALTLPGGARWQQEFDARGLRVGVTDPAGHTTRYTHDENGHLATVTDPLGAVTRLRHDPAGLLLERTDPAGGVTRLRRDSLGRVVEATDPNGGATTYVWTPEGHLAGRTGPDGATDAWTYDGEGNCLTHTDPAGGVTSFEYTHFDLLAARTEPDGSRHTFAHDTELRLTGVTNPLGMSWSYDYDGAGRLVSETDFDGRVTAYENDPLGRVATRRGPLGTTVGYTRDAMGRVVRKDAAGEVTSYAYDQAGRLVEAAGPGGRILWRYDRCGRVKTELTDDRALTLGYDAAGRRTRRITPSGRLTAYGYDAAGRTAQLRVGEQDMAFGYDAAGDEMTRRIGEALTLTTRRDAAGRVTRRDLVHARRTVHSRSFAYSPDGQVTSEADSLRGSREYELDAAGRVTGVSAEQWRESYAYQGAGSAAAEAHWPDRHAGGDAAGRRDYQGTKLLAAGTNRYAYDEAGRLVRRTRKRLSRKPETWEYGYDAEDRLTRVRTPDGTLWRYRYDPLGRRTAKERMAADGETVAERTEFVWDGPVLAEQTTAPHDGLAHRTTLTWDYAGLTPVAQTERLTEDATQAEIDSRFFAITTDLIGTPTELVDAQGRIAWHSRATLWGVTGWNADADAYTPLRFPGQYFDPESGLHYNCHRYYDPFTARYTTPDPLGLSPAPDPAGYVQNPHTLSDPLGLMPYEDNGGLGDLHKVPKPDPAADKLAEKLGGESRVKFENDPTGREFDAISDDYVAQSKPAGMQMGSAFRNQAKATFERAIESGRTPYFHFEGEPAPGVVAKLEDYGRRYGIEPVIDISPL